VQRSELTLAADEHLVRPGGIGGRRVRRRRRRRDRRSVLVAAHPGPQHLHLLGQDGTFKLDQRRARVQAELVGEHPACTPQRRERVGLPGAAPQGENQQPPALFPQRLLAREHLGQRHRLGHRSAPQRHLDE
jgi:hypothetical protein